MPTKLSIPFSTKQYTSWDNFTPIEGSIYIFGISVEARSVHPDQWEQNTRNVEFVRVWSEDTGNTPFSTCRLEYADKSQVLHLRAGENLAEFIRNIPGTRIYIDINGLSHDVWAPLLRASVNCSVPKVVEKGIGISYPIKKAN